METCGDGSYLCDELNDFDKYSKRNIPRYDGSRISRK